VDNFHPHCTIPAPTSTAARPAEHSRKANSYENPHQVRQDFGTASFLGGSRTVFNIGGNKYRLIVDMRYDLGRVYIREVLTHDEYDRKAQDGML
jgi:mRNA interferase HigB